jgi:hypothetical protein
MLRAAALPLLALLVSGCTAGFGPSFAAPEPPPGARDTNPQVVAACRQQAANLLTRQDCGQLIREDERDSRLGSETTGTAAFRAPIDRLSREYRFEQMVEECVRANTQASAPAPAATPVAPSGR